MAIDSASQAQHNPLGLSIDFMFGRGYLWSKQVQLSDWIALDALRMEIPDLQFPFDARGGLHRFRHTRCLVREIELSISESGLQDMLLRAAQSIEGFEGLQVRFLEDAIHVSLRMRFFGAHTHLSFRVALVPPEPARADEIHLSLYDYRAYGPLPYPARLLAHELVTALLQTPTLRPPGRGRSFSVGVAGDILSFRPLKLILLHLFPKHGWKLPNLSGVLLDGAKIRPGKVTLRASARDDAWYTIQQDDFQLSASREGARALAAYEAKDLFSHVDQAIFEGKIDEALTLLATFRETYGPHPELNARALDCLLANPTARNIAEAQALLQELERDHTDPLHHALAMPSIALLTKQPTERIVSAFNALSDLLKQRNDLDDWVLCELAITALLQEHHPEDAITRLRDVLKVAPRHKQTLEQLRGLYARTGDFGGFEEVLKRLTGIYSDKATLTQTYMDLATHLIDKRGQVKEARLYLERVLRLNPAQEDALHTLGTSYVLSQQPLRAIKAFGAAARAAVAREDFAFSAALHKRIANTWMDHLEHPSEALLSTRRSLELLALVTDKTPEFKAQHLDTLEYMAVLSESRNRTDEALRCWIELADLLEAQLDERPQQTIAAGGWSAPVESLVKTQPPEVDDLTRRLIQAHEHLGELYTQGQNEDAAASHWRRVLELDPDALVATQRLEQDLQQRGRPEQLIAFYRERMAQTHQQAHRVDLALNLARVYEQLGMIEEAQLNLQEALRLDPERPEARAQLIDVLRGDGRYETLRKALQTLLLRLRDRTARADVLLVLAPMLLEQLEEPRQSARHYFEALDLVPGSIAALKGVRVALQDIIHADGVSAPAPVGEGSVGELQERVLLKLIDVESDTTAQMQMLDEVAVLATHRQDAAAADEARRRIELIQEQLNTSPKDMGQRLDTLLSVQETKTPKARFDKTYIKEPPNTALPEIPSALGQKIEEVVLAKIPKPPLDAQEHTTSAQDAPAINVKSFRGKLQLALRNSGKITEGAPWAKLLGNATPTTPSVPIKGPRPEPEEEEEDTRHDDDTKSPWDVNTRTGAVSLGNVLDDAWDAMAQTASIDAARQADNPQELTDQIEALLRRGPLDRHPTLERAQYLALAREVGELLYYDLEQSEKARNYLEMVRDHDPDGLGQMSSLLNALESIYEESGLVENRLNLLQDRMLKSQNPDMATTYRLLIAQMLWDEREDFDGAVSHLSAILEDDPSHESAHRLMAKMATERGQWKDAARHYERVLTERTGGLDEVELERELADIYLHQLGQPLKARKRYEGVLDASPADAQALEGIKQSQAMVSDWSGYLSSLGRELGLLVGNPKGIDLLTKTFTLEEISPPLRTAASQIMADAASIAQEKLQDLTLAHKLWGTSYEFWPEQIDALEARIHIAREHGMASLAKDLETYAALLLDPYAQFEALFEAAKLHIESQDNEDDTRATLAEAIAIVEGLEPAPDALEEARRMLQGLS